MLKGSQTKGEKLQKEIVADQKKHFPDHADNIKSSPMSAHREDLQLTDEASKAIPFSFEAKYKEKGLSKCTLHTNKLNAKLPIY